MPTTFLSLPRELRDMVYQCLLGGDEHITLAHRHLSSKRLYSPRDVDPATQLPQLIALASFNDSRSLYPSILGTCHQVHEEAIKKLYTDKRFKYTFGEEDPDQSGPSESDRVRFREIIPQTLRKIESFEVVVEQDTPSIVTREEAENIIALLSSIDGWLKRLFLHIRPFRCHRHENCGVQDFLDTVLHSKAITDSVAALKISQDIVVVIRVRDDTAKTISETFIEAFSTATGRCGKFLAESEGIDDDDDFFEWQWSLNPIPGKNGVMTTR